MKYLALIFLLSTTAFADLVRQHERDLNIIENSGFENGNARWTESGTSVFTIVTSGANIGVGSATASWDAGAAAETLTSKQKNIPAGLFGADCDVAFLTKGGDANIDVEVIDGALAVQATATLSATANFERKVLTFTCPASGTLAIRLISSADTAVVYFDQIFVGKAGASIFTTLPNDSVGTPQIVTDGVDSDEIAANAVKTSEIDTDAVTALKMADNSVVGGTGGTIQDDTITAADLAPDSVNSSELLNGAVDLSHMSVNSVDSDQYVDGSIDNAHIGDNQINSEHYATGSIDNEHIGDDQINSEHYFAGSIDNEHIGDNQIGNEHYADDSISQVHLKDNSVDSAQYVNGSIDLEHMSSQSVDSDNIVNETIVSADIDNGTVSLVDMNSNAVNSTTIVNFSILQEDISTFFMDESTGGSVTVTDNMNMASEAIANLKFSRVGNYVFFSFVLILDFLFPSVESEVSINNLPFVTSFDDTFDLTGTCALATTTTVSNDRSISASLFATTTGSADSMRMRILDAPYAIVSPDRNWVCHGMYHIE